MKNSTYVAFSLLLIITLVTPSCDLLMKKAPESAQKAEGQEPNVRIVDVNPPELYNNAHIKGAINVPLDKVKEVSEGWNKKTPVVVYCASYDCTASDDVAEQLQKLGFEDVSVYPGGINAWVFSAKKNKEAYPFEGAATGDFFAKEVAVSAPKPGVKVVKVEELAKLVGEAQKPAAAAAA